MATVLKLALQNPQLKLTFKTAVFLAVLVWARQQEFGLISIVAAMAAASIFYLRPIFQTFHYLYQFLVFLAVGLLFLSQISDPYLFILGLGLVGGLFYLLLGLKNLVFINRWLASWLFHLGVFYITLLIFFRQLPEEGFSFRLIALFLIAGVLLNGLIKGRWIWAWASAFLLIQGVWIIGLLPIGYWQLANFGILLFWLISDLVLGYRQKILTGRIITQKIAMFILLAVIIFLTSRWTI